MAALGARRDGRGGKAWAHRAGLTHAARIHSLRASRRGPGAGAAAGARCRPVCPRARARNEPAQNGGLVGGALAPTSAHLEIAQRSEPLRSLLVQCQLLAARSRTLFASAHALLLSFMGNSSTRRPKHGEARIFRSQNIGIFP